MADTIKNLLSDNSVSADEAAHKIAGPCIEAINKDEDASKIEDQLQALWSAVLTAAEQTPHDQQDKLVEIVRSIKTLPGATDKAKKITVWDEEVSWDKLPLFGAAAREQLDTAQEKSDDACVNINSFFARLTAAGVNDLSLFAIWVLRGTLEDPSADQIAQEASPRLLKATSTWFIYASGALKKASSEGKQFDGKIAKPGASLAEHKDENGWRGFCNDRWKIWQDRLSTLKSTDLPEDVKSLVARAVDSF
ncbi:hypothetical protein FHETE_5991 [Fusarium heterosporum]|uniref:Uncharacterized protein n=1 Tax=Fusarium heterosporum TaxID=42747 RepID=A0A8H5TCX3_FUSHE|nr:hypothetical protein FHETE_5991 [Fusarium heterosporum]